MVSFIEAGGSISWHLRETTLWRSTTGLEKRSENFADEVASMMK